MPARIILHKGNAFALHRLTDNSGRHTLGRLCLLECRVDLVKVIAVDIDYVEVDASNFLSIG